MTTAGPVPGHTPPPISPARATLVATGLQITADVAAARAAAAWARATAAGATPEDLTAARSQATTLAGPAVADDPVTLDLHATTPTAQGRRP